MMQEAMLMAYCKAVLIGACWSWYHPWWVVSEFVRENMRRSSDRLCLALYKCTEALIQVIALFWIWHKGTVPSTHCNLPQKCLGSLQWVEELPACGLWEWFLSHYKWKVQQMCETLSLDLKKKVVLMIFITISFCSKYWSFLHFLLFGQYFMQVH